jgi:hypothetical protein
LREHIGYAYVKKPSPLPVTILRICGDGGKVASSEKIPVRSSPVLPYHHSPRVDFYRVILKWVFPMAKNGWGGCKSQLMVKEVVILRKEFLDRGSTN